MLKVSFVSSLIIILASTILSSGAIFVGSFANPHTITAVMSVRTVENDSSLRLALFDLNYSLSVNYGIPIAHILDIDLWYAPYEVLVTTRHDDYPNKTYERGLYLHHLLTHETIPVHTAYTDNPIINSNYPKATSHEQIIFFEPVDGSVYRFDLPSGTIDQYDVGTELFPTWMERRSLKPFGETERVTAFDRINTFIQWSDDRSFATYIEDARRGTGGLLLIDAETGSSKRLTDGLILYYALRRWRE